MLDKLRDLSESVAIIDGTDNRVISGSDMGDVPGVLKDHGEALMKLIEGSGTLQELQDVMIARYGEAAMLHINDVRVANVIGVPGIHVKRKVSDIILPNGVVPMEHKTNMGENVVDPYGFASKSVTPDVSYSLLGKLSALRPGSTDFNEELFNIIMNEKVDFEPAGAALEMSEGENVYMPAYKVHNLEELLEEFNSEIQEGDISTAKHHLINQ